MKGSKISRRDVVIGSGALAAGAAFSTRVLSAAPPASPVTPALIEAAKKEGKVTWYTSIDLKLSEQIGKAFEAKYPGITCKVERSGAERLLQRISQEYSANVHAVDVVNSSDAALLVYWSPTFRKTWPSSIRPSTRTWTACLPVSASTSASLLTTPRW